MKIAIANAKKGLLKKTENTPFHFCISLAYRSNQISFLWEWTISIRTHKTKTWKALKLYCEEK